MKFFNFILVIVALFTIAYKTINAQIDTEEKKSTTESESINKDYIPTSFFGFGFQSVIPRGIYYSKLHNEGYGIGINAGIKIPSTGVYVGIDALYSLIRLDEWDVSTIEAVYGDYFDVWSTSNFASIHLFVRAQPERELFQPYLEALIGMNILWHMSTIDWDDGDDSEESDVNLSSGALSYGIGGGINIPLLIIDMDEVVLKGIYADINFRFMFGGKAEYIMKGQRHQSDGEVYYNSTKSATDNYSIRIGLIFKF